MKKNGVKKNREIIQQEKCCFNPKERVQRFQESVETFYSKLETEWLHSLKTRDCRFELGERECWAFEKELGRYKVKVKDIIIDNMHIILKPIGTMYQGVFGRIDLIYEAKSEMFVLIGKGIVSPRQLLDRIDLESRTAPLPPLCELEWKYVSKYPNLKYEIIDTDVFFNIIKRVIYG